MTGVIKVPVAMTPIVEQYLGDELRDVIEAVKSGCILSKRYFIEAFEEKFAKIMKRESYKGDCDENQRN